MKKFFVSLFLFLFLFSCGKKEKTIEIDNENNLSDNVTEEDEQTGELNTVFKDGQMFNEMTFDEVKQNIWN